MVCKSQKKENILSAAIELFVELGIHGTSISTIAEKAGVATGSVYTYFASKEDLINSAFSMIQKQKINYIMDNFDNNQSIKEQFYQFMQNVLLYLYEHPTHFKFMRIYYFSPIIKEEVRNNERENFNPLLDILKQGKSEGIIAKINDDDLFCQIYGGITSLLHWRLHHKLAMNQDDIHHIIDLSWRAIATR